MRWASEPLINLTGAPALASAGPPIYVQDWWGCAFNFTPRTPPGCRLTITWGDLSSDGKSIDLNKPFTQLMFSAVSDEPLLHALPHLGPYMFCEIDIGLGPGQYDLIVRHTNRQERPAEIVQGPLIFEPTTGFAPGTSKFSLPGYIGPAYAYAFSAVSGADVNVQLHGHDIVTGADVLLDQIYKGADNSYRTPRQIWLPPLVNEIWVVNNAAGVQQVNFAIQPAYR